MTVTKLEKYTKLYNTLRVLEDAYCSGDFAEFVALLADDCVYESMWVLEPLRGREAVANHLLAKGRSIRECEAYPRCWIVELVGNMNPLPETDVIVNGQTKRGAIALAYEPGKFCLMMSQKLDDETHEVLVDLKLNEDGKISRMDLCMPELFRTNEMCPHIVLLPAMGEEENKAALIRISDGYFSELRLFLGIAGLDFCEYDNLVVPMERWVKALGFWQEFVDAASYDAIAEKFAGIDYESWTVSDPYVLDCLGYSGAALWRRRKENRRMLELLLEWTQKYQDRNDSICIYGY